MSDVQLDAAELDEFVAPPKPPPQRWAPPCTDDYDHAVVRVILDEEPERRAIDRPAARRKRRSRKVKVELLSVIALLCALSGIVLFALGGATHDGVIAACDASVAEVGSGVSALQAENPGTVPLASASWRAALLPGSAYAGAPYLGSWPHSGFYVVSIAGTAGRIDDGDGVRPAPGDVLITITATRKVYDATAHPGAACSKL